jgi:ATP-binding cassette, subfamily C (CFTR/MRP), member 1
MGYRAMAVLRGGMIAIVYQKMMILPLGNVNQSSAMSIMGADVDTLAESLHLLICDSWANIIQLGIATYLLANELGAVCIAPLVVAISECLLFHAIYFPFSNSKRWPELTLFEAFTVFSGMMGKYITSRQKLWLDYIETRVNFTTEVLGSIKSVKMLGLTEKMASIIEQMRAEEIKRIKGFRAVGSVNTLLSMASPCVHVPHISMSIILADPTQSTLRSS